MQSIWCQWYSLELSQSGWKTLILEPLSCFPNQWVQMSTHTTELNSTSFDTMLRVDYMDPFPPIGAICSHILRKV